MTNRFSMPAWVLTIVFFIALFAHADLAPLEDTHWDAPIYVQLSKRAAETPILAGYHEHAREIQPGPAGAHWNFTRIGHILLLGEVTRLFGPTETALLAMQWLYRLFMALGVSLCVAVGLRLVKLLRTEKPDSIWWAGYAIAAVTFVASDSYRGLQGHMISEPPAFASLALFALALLRAVERRSLVTGALAGGMLFLVFFIRADAVLPGGIFMLVLAATLALKGKGAALPSLVVAALVSFVFYTVYAWWFSPLVDPMTLATFSGAAKLMYRGLPIRSMIQIVIAGGFLWIGAVASAAIWRDPVVRFAAAWLVLALLYLTSVSLQGGSIQVRVAFFVALPLMVLAGEGWSWILGRLLNHKDVRPMIVAIVLLAVLALTPYSPTIRILRELAINQLSPAARMHVFLSATPQGGVRPFSYDSDSRLGLIVRPTSELSTFDYRQARELGAFLFQPERPVYLLWPRMDIADENSLQEFMGLIRYFGKNYPENADIVLNRLPNKVTSGPCTSKVPTAIEPVVFCTVLTRPEREKLQQEKTPIFVVGADGYPTPEVQPDKLKMVLKTPPYTLYEVVSQ